MDGIFRAWFDFTLTLAALLGGFGYFSAQNPTDDVGIIIVAACYVAPIALSGMRYALRYGAPAGTLFYWLAAVLMGFSALLIGGAVGIYVLGPPQDLSFRDLLNDPSKPFWALLGPGGGLATVALVRILLPFLADFGGVGHADEPVSRPERIAVVARPNRASGDAVGELFWMWLDFALVYLAVLVGCLACAMLTADEGLAAMLGALWLVPIIVAAYGHTRRMTALPSAGILWLTCTILALTGLLLDVGGVLAYERLTGDPVMASPMLKVYFSLNMIRTGLFWLVLALFMAASRRLRAA